MATSQTTDLFLGLTPEKVLAAVEAGGLSCRPVCYPLNSFENRVYEVELEDRSRVVAKFYRPGRWSEEQILEEHRFLRELEAAEIPVCNVRPFPDGATLKRIDEIYYSISARQGGRAPDELGEAEVARLGMLVGRLHSVGASSTAPSRPALSADRYARDPVDFMAERGVVPEHFSRRFFDAALSIADLAEEALAGVPTHRIHADLHLGNILFRDGLLRVLDFDDMVSGPAVQDLWLALPGRDRETRRLREIFIESYEQFRLFDRGTLRLIEPLRGLRMVRYIGWLARRWHDPAFKAAWPEFGTDEYWQNQTEDLEGQLAAVKGESVVDPLANPEEDTSLASEEPELSNRDYFWDWEGD